MTPTRSLLLPLALPLTLSGCASYAGIAVTPNGTVWLATNLPSTLGGVRAGPIYACTPHGAELWCYPVPLRGGP